jgi:hypothetical protein
MKNYFKGVKDGHSAKFMFFHDETIWDIQGAFHEAQMWEEDGYKLSVWNPVSLPGKWDRLPLIGHRCKSEVQADLKASLRNQGGYQELISAIGNRAMKTECYADELLAIEVRYSEVRDGE